LQPPDLARRFSRLWGPDGARCTPGCHVTWLPPLGFLAVSGANLFCEPVRMSYDGCIGGGRGMQNMGASATESFTSPPTRFHKQKPPNPLQVLWESMLLSLAALLFTRRGLCCGRSATASAISHHHIVPVFSRWRTVAATVYETESNQRLSSLEGKTRGTQASFLSFLSIYFSLALSLCSVFLVKLYCIVSYST